MKWLESTLTTKMFFNSGLFLILDGMPMINWINFLFVFSQRWNFYQGLNFGAKLMLFVFFCSTTLLSIFWVNKSALTPKLDLAKIFRKKMANAAFFMSKWTIFFKSAKTKCFWYESVVPWFKGLKWETSQFQSNFHLF